MVEGVDHADPLVGVQGEHLAQEVDGLVGHAGGQGVQVGDRGRLGASREDVSFGGLAGELHVVDAGGAKEIGDEFQLLDGALGLEQNASAQKLAKDAAHAPHVDGRGVVFGAHEDLGSAVVLRHDLLSHVFAAVLFFDPEMVNKVMKLAAEA